MAGCRVFSSAGTGFVDFRLQTARCLRVAVSVFACEESTKRADTWLDVMFSALPTLALSTSDCRQRAAYELPFLFLPAKRVQRGQARGWMSCFRLCRHWLCRLQIAGSALLMSCCFCSCPRREYKEGRHVAGCRVFSSAGTGLVDFRLQAACC